MAKGPTPPIAKKEPHEISIHGDTRIDNYYWMRDDSRTDPEIIAHLTAENDYKEAMLAGTKELQQELYDEIVGRIEKDKSTVPYQLDNYYYYTRFEPAQEYPVYARKKDGLDNNEQILLNVNELAKGHDYFNVAATEVSPDHSLLAYSHDSVGRRIYTIRIKDIASEKLLEDTLKNTSGNLVWANDNKTIFYIKKDPQTLLGYQVYRHTLGTPQATDVLVYEETDSSFYTSLSKSLDGTLIKIGHYSTETKGQSLLDANQPNGKFEHFYPLQEGHEYTVSKSGQSYYILTNKDAKNFRLMKADESSRLNFNQWEEVIPHREDTQLTGVIAFKDFIAVTERQNGLIKIRVMGINNSSSRFVEFNDPAYSAGFGTNKNFSSKTLRYEYSSLTTPNSIYDFNMETGRNELLKQDKVLGEFNPADYNSERLFITARDNTKVPVSLVYKKQKFSRDGTNPLYQYGYGSYGATMDPRFRSNWLSLLDRGFVVAIAHVRGSQMLGRQWYEDGKMFHKINTFTDFIDVTDSLVDKKYAARDKVFIAGGSAGGLLMGAVINMAPEKYRGVAAHVPFVDVVTTMLDESIPLTTNEFDEWGNPKNEDSYEYMLSYSPYDNVKKQDYPNLLVTTGLHDSQVQYFEPMKWVAKLREYKTDNNMLLMHTNMEAGHGGASGRFERLKQTAMEYAFFLDILNSEK
nr:S9 family peptidase [Kangiella sediminilitoris]